MKKPKSLTVDDLLELIVDVAYEQATRDQSGGNWFKEFIAKIEEKQGLSHHKN